MSVLRRAKLRTPDGTESIEYPLGVEAENVEVANQENLSQRLVRIDEDLEKNEEDIAAVNEIAGTNRQNIGAAEVRIDALERRSASAEDIPCNNGYNVQETIGDIDVDNDGSIEFQLADLKNTEKNFLPCYLGLRKRFITGTTYGLTLQYSIDGIHFIDIKNLPDTITCGENSAVNLHKIKDYWYIMLDRRYWYSQDFITWTNDAFATISSTQYLWASYLYDFEDRIEVFYAYCSDKTRKVPVVTQTGETTYFVIKHKVINIQNGVITPFDPATGETVIGDNTTNSYIDPSLTYFNNKYYFACKDEINKNLKVYEYNNGNIVDTGFTHAALGIEAPKLIATEKELLMYADPYSLISKLNLQYGNVKWTYGRRLEIRTTVIDENNTIQTNALWECIKGMYSNHIAYMKCDNYEDILTIKNIAELGFYKPDDAVHNLPKMMDILQSEIAVDPETGYKKYALINHPFLIQRILGESWYTNRIYLSFEKVFKDVDSVLFMAGDPRPNYYAGYHVNDIQNENCTNNQRLKFTDYTLQKLFILSASLESNPKNILMIPYEQYPVVFRDSITRTSYDIILNEKFEDGIFRYASLIIGGNASNLSQIPLILNSQEIRISSNNNHFAQDLKIVWIDTTIGKLRLTTENGETQFYGGYSLSYYGK